MRQLRKILGISNALADESRVRTIAALNRRQLCVCQIAELLQLAPSTVSKHLSILWEAGLVESQKTGRWVCYTLAQEPDDIVRQSLEWMQQGLRRDVRIGEDRRQLKHILHEKPEDLARRQSAKIKGGLFLPAIQPSDRRTSC